MRPLLIAYNRVSPSVLEDLEKDYEVIYFDRNEYINDPLFKKALQSASGIIGLELKVSRVLLDLAPNLKIISNVSVGYDNLDLDELSKRNIMATNTPDVLTDTTADAIFSILMATARRIPELDLYVKQGKWKKYLTHAQFGIDIHHKKIGIIGMGRIGQAIAKRARLGFDMDVLYFNRTRKPEVGKELDASYVSMDQLLGESDFICLIVPATPETRNLIGMKEFKKMKNTAIFINGSRGLNVDEEALCDALENGEILAAGTDVYSIEPVPATSRLLKYDNLLTLPHIGGATTENELRMSRLAAKNLKIGLEGGVPPNLLNKVSVSGV